jgi:NADPH:quinone reductase-like Zn-dependent oxidoreductase
VGIRIIKDHRYVSLHKALVYDAPGPPDEVLQLRQLENSASLADKEVRVKFLKVRTF